MNQVEQLQSEIHVVTSKNAEHLLDGGDGPWLLDFWAPWCTQCRAIEPTLHKLKDRFQNKLAVGKINVDMNHELSRRFGVRSLPTLLLIHSGAERARLTAGTYSVDQLVAEIEPHL